MTDNRGYYPQNGDKLKKSKFSLWKIKESWLGRLVKNLIKTPSQIGKMGKNTVKNINQRMFPGRK